MVSGALAGHPWILWRVGATLRHAAWEPVRGSWRWRATGGAGPWRLRIDRQGKQSQAVLRVGEPHRREQVATGAAALAFAEEHQLAALTTPAGGHAYRCVKLVAMPCSVDS